MVETELAKVYAGSERTLAGVAKSVHFHDWLMDIEFNASRNSYQLSSWFKSLICVLQVIQRVWMSWETDSSHWMTNCHESCKMSFAITMIRTQKARRSNKQPQKVWSVLIQHGLLYQVCREIETYPILALISLHVQNTWVRSIISDNDWHMVTIVYFQQFRAIRGLFA